MKSEPIKTTRHAMDHARTDYHYVELVKALKEERDLAIKERDEARDDADARFAHSDHKIAKYYRRWRQAEQRARVTNAALEDSVRALDRWRVVVDRLEAELTSAHRDPVTSCTKEASELDDSQREELKP